MQYFSNIVSTLAHDVKPMPRDSPQLTRMLLHPGIDGWIPLDRIREPKNLIHGYYAQKRRDNAGHPNLTVASAV